MPILVKTLMLKRVKKRDVLPRPDSILKPSPLLKTYVNPKNAKTDNAIKWNINGSNSSRIIEIWKRTPSKAPVPASWETLAWAKSWGTGASEAMLVRDRGG